MASSRSIWTAMIGAGLMLAHQVAGKAVRDAFFLSNYPASDLPAMVIAAAATSLAFVLVFARALGRLGPRRLVPAGFLISSLGHVTEYFVASSAAVSVIIYLHIVALGAILLSGFWSQISESFDPRAAKQHFGRITGAGTLGGIVGGAMAERAAALAGSSSVLLLLAGFHLLCAVALASLRTDPSAGTPEEAPVEPVSPRELFRRAPYLVPIALLVLAGTTSAAIIDYLFKSGAGQALGKGTPLLRFFAAFYTSTQVLTFLAQTALSRISLEKFGIGRTISALPFGVGSGAAAVLLFPAFPVIVALRSAELVLRGSLFRSAYELLYTPVAPAEKRAAKTLIDVGCDRLGDAVGGGIVQLVLTFGSPFVTSGLLGITVAVASAAAWIAVRLDGAYTGLVQKRLVDRAVELDLSGIQDSTTRSALLSATKLGIPAIRPEQTLKIQAPPTAWIATSDPTLDTLQELRSGDTIRVLAALKEIEQPKPIIAAQLLRLLAWDEVRHDAREVLLRNPSNIAGLLIDHLVGGESVPLGIRRSVPRILSHCDSQLAVQGLVDGLKDSRFEVRFQCSRALDTLHARVSSLRIPEDAIYRAIEREFEVARHIWSSRRTVGRDGSDPEAFLVQDLRERADQSLEHVFSLFATVLPREPIRVAFRALHGDDQVLKGLAAEYLDGVLPARISERLWSVLEARPNISKERMSSNQETLTELMRASNNSGAG